MKTSDLLSNSLNRNFRISHRFLNMVIPLSALFIKPLRLSSMIALVLFSAFTIPTSTIASNGAPQRFVLNCNVRNAHYGYRLYRVSHEPTPGDASGITELRYTDDGTERAARGRYAEVEIPKNPTLDDILDYSTPEKRAISNLQFSEPGYDVSRPNELIPKYVKVLMFGNGGSAFYNTPENGTFYSYFDRDRNLLVSLREDGGLLRPCN
jgi:hypothetical protein